MSLWTDPDRWAGLRSGETCPVCRGGGPREVVAELAASWVTMGEAAPMRGHCCVVFRRHAVELHDLTPAEGAAFMHDAQQVSRAVQAVTGAVKLNYELHGNTLPHLHLHVFPRYLGDPFEGGPVDPRAVRGPVYAPGEFAEARRRLVEALTADGAT